jgi:hypothetical protein
LQKGATLTVVVAASSFPEFDLNNVPSEPILVATDKTRAAVLDLRVAAKPTELISPTRVAN